MTINFTQVLAFSIPALLLLISNYLIIRMFFNQQSKKDLSQLKIQTEELKALHKNEDKKLITPIRLQAYERLALYLERISPSSLIFRSMRPELNSIQFQSVLLKNIRDEFEHNLSQQIYVSSETWEMIKNAKEEIVKLINTASAQVQVEDPAIELSKKIFELTVGNEKLPTDKALELMKKEIRNFY